MFESLTSKFEDAFRRISGRGTLGETDIDEALKEIRRALLEADVNYKVVREFCDAVRAKSLGAELNKSLTPSQTVIKFVYEELVKAMGEHTPLNVRHAPPVILMMVGLQGSGKTTSSAKLARFLRDELKRRPLLVPADVYRPAAIEQLKTLGRDLNIDVFDSKATDDPLDIANRAHAYAKSAGFDTLILDTAGRLQIDEEMMEELIEIIEAVEPHEVLLVADAMTGQEAVNVAKGFDDRLDVDGIILTKLDGDARGGAALSMRATTEKPIKFIGVGEKTDALEPFHPDRMASRILGMGDVLTLIEKASKQVTVEDAAALHKKMKKDQFTFEDFHSQLQTIKKMGSMSSLMQMVPGMGKMTQGLDDAVADQELKRVEAIILSMTPAERRDADLINGSRRKRIARGSGTSVEEVNRLLRQFVEMRKMMKSLTKLGPKALRGLGNLKQAGAMLRRG
jgi:signal recognition particle subunit SRP54